MKINHLHENDRPMTGIVPRQALCLHVAEFLARATVLGLRVVEPVAEAGSRLVWSVAGLVQAVADALSARFPVCVVRGELSAFTRVRPAGIATSA